MQLLSVRLENIGGFGTSEMATFENRLLIGENNSGKTSLLRIIDWCLNGADGEFLLGRRDLTPLEQRLLIPARETRNKARRMFLRISIPDGRTARKFQAVDGIAEVRIQFRAGEHFVKLTSPVRGERPDSEPKAVELMRLLQTEYCALYVGAARDGHSEVFDESLRSALRLQFRDGLIHEGIGKPKADPAKIRKMAADLGILGSQHAMKVWRASEKHMHGVFDVNARFGLDLTPDEIIELLVDRIQPYFSLGDHDANSVAVNHLGAGLQSMLAMALMRIARSSAPRRLLLLEEPEAFLHPSAQRTLARHVFRDADTQVIATTHSPAVLAEAAPSEIVVMRGHSAFPAAAATAEQEAKDRYLLATWASGSMFDRSLLLVEGPGDLAFFEELRRKMEEFFPIPVLSRMRVAATGSKDSFGPWLRFLRRFHDARSGAYAFDYLVCADSADAAASVTRAFRESGISLPQEMASSMHSLTDGIDIKNIAVADAQTISDRTSLVNRIAAKQQVPIHFTSVDLEYAMVSSLSDSRAREFAEMLGFGATTRHKLAAQLGSKGGEGSASDKPGAKAPYARAELARFLEWDEVPMQVKDLLWRWSLPAARGVVVARPRQLR